MSWVPLCVIKIKQTNINSNEMNKTTETLNYNLENEASQTGKQACSTVHVLSAKTPFKRIDIGFILQNLVSLEG